MLWAFLFLFLNWIGVHLSTVKAITIEFRQVLVGRRFGRIFRASQFSYAVDFRLPRAEYLFISIEPAAPRIYLIRRRLRELEKASLPLSQFALHVRKHLSGAEVADVRQIENERVIFFDLDGVSETGQATRNSLVAQLTGRSANLFLLDRDGMIIEGCRETRGAGQEIGDAYAPPERAGRDVSGSTDILENVPAGELSEALDRHYQERENKNRFDSLAGAARAKLKRETAKKRRLVERMNADLNEHGDADQWKRMGDLLLANVATATRDGDAVTVVDFFDSETPSVEIKIGKDVPVTEAAEKFFRRYTKARNAVVEIERRMKETEKELVQLDAKSTEVEQAIESGDEEFLRRVTGKEEAAPTKKRTAASSPPPGTRKFLSSDGLEILVGKKATDNDNLTFRVAKSLDLWMHAADYPGSHVIVRNPNRKEIPHRTLLEAAQLAAFYSQGNKQTKAAVHYTQKKFVNKPRGAASGLVSLAKFKTILVEPVVPDSVVKA